VRCCGDAAAISQGVATCDAFAAEEGVCTSAKSCEELADGYSGPCTDKPTSGCGWKKGFGRKDICTDGTIGPEQSCVRRSTWQDAEATCLGHGARLCTVEEIRGAPPARSRL
jgi:hypothetical protein